MSRREKWKQQVERYMNRRYRDLQPPSAAEDAPSDIPRPDAAEIELRVTRRFGVVKAAEKLDRENDLFHLATYAFPDKKPYEIISLLNEAQGNDNGRDG